MVETQQQIMKHTFEIEGEDWLVILLALAKLSHSRPGWHEGCLLPLAQKLGGESLYGNYRSFGPDPEPGGSEEMDFTFKWKADGKAHQTVIKAPSYAIACYRLAKHHVESGAIRPGAVPPDFEMDLTEAKKEGE